MRSASNLCVLGLVLGTSLTVSSFPTVVGTPWTVVSQGTAVPNGAFTFGGTGGIPIGVDFTGVGTLPSLGTLPLNPDSRIYRGQATVTPFLQEFIQPFQNVL